MSSIVIAGDTSGQISLAAPAIAGTNTVTLPAATGTVELVTLGTAVNSTSGTSIDFTNIPSWAKRITVMFSGVSTSGTSDYIIQLGYGATPTYVTSGYLGSNTSFTGAAQSNFSSGFAVTRNPSASSVYHGSAILTLLGSNVWVEQAILGLSSGANGTTSAGSVPVANQLTAVRITTAGGTDTFDAGSINIMWEG